MSDRTASPPTLGFLTVQQEPAGWAGYYLVTNAWGRPLEFRLTTAVQPTRVQQLLYGNTLTEYLHGEVIGKALVEKTSILPGLIVADSVSALGLRAHTAVPVVALVPDAGHAPDRIAVRHARFPHPFWVHAQHAADRETIAPDAAPTRFVIRTISSRAMSICA